MFRRFRKRVELRLAVEGGRFAPGGAVPATVEIVARRDVVIDATRFELVRTLETEVQQLKSDWATHSFQAQRGAVRTRTVVDSKPLAQPGRMAAGRPVRVREVFNLPAEALPSVDTKEARLRWTVEARGRDAADAIPLLVVADAPNLAGSADAPVAFADHGAHLSFADLSSRRLGPGDSVSGTLVIEPGGAEIQRAVIVLGLASAALVPQGMSDRHEVVRKVVAQGHDLADQVAARRMVRIPFSLTVPDPVPAPSIETHSFTVGWFLRAFALHPGLTTPSSEVQVDLYVRATQAPVGP